MKKFIFSLCLLAGAAHAEQWMQTQNNAGGKILFTAAKCDGEGRLVISTVPGGDTFRGCWYYFSGMVHVVWTDPRLRGKTSAFDLDILEFKSTEDL